MTKIANANAMTETRATEGDARERRRICAISSALMRTRRPTCRSGQRRHPAANPGVPTRLLLHLPRPTLRGA